ncbi:uncharacterized protein LALA0_S04e09582g [Lachancea lanzarotensis]|uniref:LALA0S04e09582g1_1 n=1 Tax=Lachancea lanzarotensis TaxID=1245769 RepID=A0A0C7N2G9_9SACH|nr:uncharacterized protein LALA0_S04e09582g [Lachancea lanzarotensis]CEP62177.1 LALA0S04e09582g1_1 [Lachancea lanzarotensis]
MGNSPSKPLRGIKNDPNAPPSLRFTRKRQMVIPVAYGKRKEYLCFPTAHSYELFKARGKKFSTPENMQDEDLGVPLFEFKNLGPLERFGSSENERYLISKFVCQSISQPPPYFESIVVCQSETHIIYKSPFCTVIKAFKTSRCSYDFIFYTPNEMPPLRLVQHCSSVGLDTRLGDWDVSWRRTGKEDYELLVLLPPEESATIPGNHPNHNLFEPNAPVWAQYIDAEESFSHSMSGKFAVLNIGETDLESDSTAYGIASIPWFSLVIACMALVQCHRIQEYRHRSRGPGRRYYNATPLMGITNAGYGYY